jgi:hypothetical protein
MILSFLNFKREQRVESQCLCSEEVTKTLEGVKKLEVLTLIDFG